MNTARRRLLKRAVQLRARLEPSKKAGKRRILRKALALRAQLNGTIRELRRDLAAAKKTPARRGLEGVLRMFTPAVAA